ncbi:MAG: hypothetical protein P8X63_01445 [Desulfuromonadaceae bacterium]
MSLPQLLKKSADKLLSAYCAEQNRHREKPRTRLSYRIASNRVTLLEERHCCSCPSACHTRPVAQFRYQHHPGDFRHALDLTVECISL